ncbi:MAG: ABC transporter ATP-binding protein [Geminicoccaceae bacterium]
MTPLLETRALAKSFGGIQAISNVDLTCAAHEIHGLIGPNGAGKTTLVACLQGQLRPDRGRIMLDGRDITGLSMPARSRAGIARTFQITSIFENMSVFENVAMVTRARGGAAFRLFDGARLSVDNSNRIDEILIRTGLGRDGHHLASDLPHGAKRQLELAMAIASDPSVLLLDEPMAGLGPGETAELADVIRTLRPLAAILLIEHDMDVVFSLADRISVMVGGRVIASGSPSEVQSDPEVKRAYLGDEPC